MLASFDLRHISYLFINSNMALTSLGRQRILDAARGILLERNNNANASADRRILRCFPLKDRHFQKPLLSPEEFHTVLVDKIKTAKRRVYLASLYIGPAANPITSTKEVQLLHALQTTSAPDVKILLDRNRALRPVPIVQDANNVTTISSAEACHRALQPALSRNKETSINPPGIYLLSVLPTWQQNSLPNPYNEVAGVFHIKCYIVDDELILTGANLSEEYFTDRIDRYLWLTDCDRSKPKTQGVATTTGHDHTNSLVECYGALVEALCRHAEPYKPETSTVTDTSLSRISRQELVSALAEILTTDEEAGVCLKRTTGDDSTGIPITAYAVPTLQMPNHFYGDIISPIPQDIEVTTSVIQTFADELKINSDAAASQLCLASAYLNLTDDMLNAIAKCSSVHLLTAGSISHGFKVNSAKPGNKGKAWIPAVFDSLSRKNLEKLRSKQLLVLNDVESMTSANLWLYQRENWSFHAKGLWLAGMDTSTFHPNTEKSRKRIRIAHESSLSAVMHGSGNYGFRSAMCDFESNLILVLSDSTPSSSTLRTMLTNEWNEMCNHVALSETVAPQALSRTFTMLLPFLRRFC